MCAVGALVEAEAALLNFVVFILCGVIRGQLEGTVDVGDPPGLRPPPDTHREHGDTEQLHGQPHDQRDQSMLQDGNAAGGADRISFNSSLDPVFK